MFSNLEAQDLPLENNYESRVKTGKLFQPKKFDIRIEIITV